MGGAEDVEVTRMTVLAPRGNVFWFFSSEKNCLLPFLRSCGRHDDAGKLALIEVLAGEVGGVGGEVDQAGAVKDLAAERGGRREG